MIYFSCVEQKDPLSISTHPEGWNNAQSSNFHGKMVLESYTNADNCQSCHGVDYKGGSSGVSCYVEGCHDIYPHRDGFIDSLANGFHGKYIADSLSFSLLLCQGCHGSDYRGSDSDQKDCYKSGCHDKYNGIYPHISGFENKSSQNFHGTYIANDLNWNKDICQKCHGVDYKGNGYIEKSCYDDCHVIYPHDAGFADSLSAKFHSLSIAQTFFWDLTICQSCHGTDYSGNGYGNKNCLICHSQQDGPEACNTCHGDINSASSDTSSWAPPEDLNGNNSTTHIGVGAHQQHLTNVNITLPLLCIDCHSLPANFEDPIHIDGNLPAEIAFGDLATTFSDSAANPAWSNSQATCSNVFCHGEFKNGEKEQSLIWTSVGTGQAACNTCHGLPPGGTHDIYLGNCSNCHFTVVNSDTAFVDLNKHLNGEINVYGMVWNW